MCFVSLCQIKIQTKDRETAGALPVSSEKKIKQKQKKSTIPLILYYCKELLSQFPEREPLQAEELRSNVYNFLRTQQRTKENAKKRGGGGGFNSKTYPKRIPVAKSERKREELKRSKRKVFLHTKSI